VITPPQSNANGSYNPNITANGLRSNPQDWVQGPSPTSPLANPTASGAYPIVGTANFLGYTCYASSNSLSTITGQLIYLNTKAINDDPKNGILARAGIDIMPQNWRTAIDQTFLSTQLNLGLNFATAGTKGACSVSGVIGG
jgi:phosphate transport system substrate-binding protein